MPSNHVIFDPATIAILRKYGIAGLTAGGAATAATSNPPANKARKCPTTFRVR